ncbi:Sec-independent protein translocase protein TatB [Methylobrevis albus]|uniref:Sec-independent protein translocase protein TatB n=1 Tax=Methylobrevis albus TaxID=2793297 RepID=A0A931I467_9HYPH|nr:Sec-independent protein translocase protein TatB [Methylobrevis albus]MBH0238968.1 twin-arginine translocase subunit TatB [Methylobrevis albus]
MFDIGWTELLIVAVVAILVVGPKDLPRLLRTVGQFVSKGRRMAGEFQNQFNAALREAEREIDIEEARKVVSDVKALNPLEGVKKALDPIRTAGEDLKRDIRTIGSPATPPAATSTPSAVTTGASAAAAATAGPGAAAAHAAPAEPASTPRPVDVPAPTIVPPAEPPSFAEPAAPPPAPAASSPQAPASEMAPPAPQSPTAAPTPAAPIKTGPAGEGA